MEPAGIDALLSPCFYTTFFACGKTINKSCELAIKYVNQSIRSNLNYGKGHGPVNHLSSIKIDRKFKL